MGCCAIITDITYIIGPVVTGMVVILWKESVRIHFVVDMLTVTDFLFHCVSPFVCLGWIDRVV